jgi:hypothetical protein
MVCYARLYNRGDETVNRWRVELHEYLKNLNQRLIVLLPPLSVLHQRLEARGDLMQDAESLARLHEIFDDELKRLHAEDLPNVLVIRSENSLEENVKHCLSWLSHASTSTTKNIGEDKVQEQIAMAKLYLYKAVDIINLRGKESIISFAEGDEQRMMLMGLRRFTKYTNMPNIVALREIITSKLVDNNEYCF